MQFLISIRTCTFAAATEELIHEWADCVRLDTRGAWKLKLYIPRCIRHCQRFSTILQTVKFLPRVLTSFAEIQTSRNKAVILTVPFCTQAFDPEIGSVRVGSSVFLERALHWESEKFPESIPASSTSWLEAAVVYEVMRAH